MAEQQSQFVARDADIASLTSSWESALAGTPVVMQVASTFGGGRRALINEFLRKAASSNEDALIWRLAQTDQENGVQWLMRMYGSLIANITSDVLRRGKVEMILNGQLPSQPKRTQNWYLQFVAGLKEAKPDAEKGSIQLKVPQDNPLIALVEIVVAISRKMPIIFEFQSAATTHSVLPGQFLEALLAEATEAKSQLMVLIHDEPASDMRSSSYPAPLLDFYTRNEDKIERFELAPWGVEETNAYLASRSLEGNAARLVEIAGGRPGFIAELTDILNEQGTLNTDLEGVTLTSLVPMDIDESDLEVPEEAPEEGKRRHATSEDGARVAHLAALLGQAFPSSLIADMGGYERDSIDDLLDAMSDLFAEVQFSEEMQTWLYRFTRGTWREGILQANDTEEGHQIGRNVANFMERFLAPRGYAFLGRTARLYAEHSAFNRAALMRARAITADAPDAWGLAYELIRYYDEIKWTDQMRRTISTTLLDHMVNGGNLKAADQVHTQVTEWATEKEDRELQAWLLLNGSKLDLRRGDLYRSRDRARDAVTMYKALENNNALAEVFSHLATVELQDGKKDAAIQAINEALETAAVENEEGKKVVPANIMAQAENLRGIIARGEGKLQDAANHFARANEAGGRVGNAGLALDAGVRLGETLLAARQLDQAKDVLQKVLTAARQVQAGPVERQACQLLANVSAGGGNLQDAAQFAQRALQISQQLKLQQALPADHASFGAFLLGLNKPAEALQHLRAAEQYLQGAPAHPLNTDLQYHLGIAYLQTGKGQEAKGAFTKALPALQKGQDPRKLLSTYSGLAAVEAQAGSQDQARKLLENAMQIAKQANLKEERKRLKRQLENIG